MLEDPRQRETLEATRMLTPQLCASQRAGLPHKNKILLNYYHHTEYESLRFGFLDAWITKLNVKPEDLCPINPCMLLTCRNLALHSGQPLTMQKIQVPAGYFSLFPHPLKQPSSFQPQEVLWEWQTPSNYFCYHPFPVP